MTTRFPKFLWLCVLLSWIAVVTLQAKQVGSSKGPEDRMSSSGRLAAKVRSALNKAGVSGFAPLPAAGTGNCINTASDECDDDSSIPGGQAETSIAVDSTGQHIVVGFNDTRGFSLNPLSVSGFMYSDDGGATFVDGGQLPSPGNDSIGGTLLPEVFGDPEVKYLGECNFVYSSIVVKKFSATTAAQTMGVHVSNDCGHTWRGPIEVTPATNPNGIVNGSSPADAADKEFMDVDPETGRLMVSWSNFTPVAAGGVEISTTYTDNILDTVNPVVWSPRQVVAATDVDGQASIPRFAKGSANAYIAWRRFPSFFGNTTGFARSTDNGQTWSAPIDLSPEFFTMDYVLGNDRVNTSPSLAVDNSNGPHSGNIYVTYANNNNQDGADIYVQRSTDGGLTFSAPLAVNAKPGNDRAQWFPWVTVDSMTGRVHIFYYDQGAAHSGDLTRVSYLFSDNGGKTWKHQRDLSDVDFKAGWGNDTGQPNLGDYNQAVAQNGDLFAVWAQTSLPGFTDGQPSGNMNTPDVTFKRLSSLFSSQSVDATISANIHPPSDVKIFPLNIPQADLTTTTLLNERFNEPGLGGALPAGWIAAHGAGQNVVPWVTATGFCGSSTPVAFHTNANDGPAGGSPSRWERMISPSFAVPADSDFVTIDLAVCYDTEDDPNFNILAYDGAFLRVTDLTPGNLLRSVLAEAFEQSFKTGNQLHYPKHMPRNSDPRYFPNGDMSMWAGDSGGQFRHVQIRLVGMAGTTAQLRFEFAQDGSGTCADVRPGHTCGIAIDNIVVRSVKVTQ